MRLVNKLWVGVIKNLGWIWAAAWSNGLASLSFVLRFRSSNPGGDSGEKGKKEQITFHLFSNRIVYP
jgi:hypothetical protein